MAYVLFLFTALTWSASFILMKKAAAAFGPVSIGAGRVIGGALALAALCALSGWWRPRGAQWAWLALIVVIGFAAPYCVQPYLVVPYGSGFIGMLVGFVPLLTIAVSVPLLGVWPTTRQVLGVVGGLVCLVAVLGDGVVRAIPPAHLALAVTVPVGYAIANTLIKRCFPDAPALPLTTWCLAATALVLTPIGAAREPIRVDERLPMALAAVAALGVVGTGLCGYAFYRMIKERGPLFAGMVSYLIPIGAVVIGWIDGEAVTGIQVAALIGVILMVAVAQAPGRAPLADQST
ncbi:MAG TPA: DMT family transporter [Planctomycetota bacterium]|nr:DMT family transporter [Planctomycetota bacterium]